MDNFTFENATFKPITYPTCDTFNFVIWTICHSLICCLGIPGNIASFIAFTREKSSAAVFLLQMLALIDLTLLTCIIFVDGIPYGCSFTGKCTNWWISWPYIRYVWIMVPIFHMCSLWTSVLIAANRLDALIFYTIFKKLSV